MPWSYCALKSREGNRARQTRIERGGQEIRREEDRDKTRATVRGLRVEMDGAKKRPSNQSNPLPTVG